jgi:hypothetical protein
VVPLSVGEVHLTQQAPRLLRVVVRDRRLEALAPRGRLAQLPAQPAEEAHGGLIHDVAGYRSVDTFLAVASRREVRDYEPRSLPPEVEERIIDAGRLAGSSKNRQPWRFEIVPGELLADYVYEPTNLRGAPFVVAIVVSGKGPVSFDAGRAAQNMLLVAWNESVGSCPNAIADEPAARAALELEDEERIAIVLSFGYPAKPRDPESRSAAEWSARANRRPLQESVRRR